MQRYLCGFFKQPPPPLSSSLSLLTFFYIHFSLFTSFHFFLFTLFLSLFIFSLFSSYKKKYTTQYYTFSYSRQCITKSKHNYACHTVETNNFSFIYTIMRQLYSNLRQCLVTIQKEKQTNHQSNSHTMLNYLLLQMSKTQ